MTSSNSQVFINDLNSIAQSLILNKSDVDILPLYNQIPSTLNSNNHVFPFTTFTKLFNPDNINSSNSTNVATFINSLYVNVLEYASTASIPANAYDASDPQSPLNGLYKAFLISQGYDPLNPDLNFVQGANLLAQFNAMFSDFLQNFPFQILSSEDTIQQSPVIGGITYTVYSGNNYQNFFAAYVRYLSTTSVVQSTTQPYLLNIFTNPQAENYDYVQSYQKIYEAFNGPIGTLSSNPANWTVAQQVFVNRFSDFYVAKLAETATPDEPSGFFVTSQNLADWFNYSQNLYYNPQFSPAATVFDARSTIILDEVLRALISMIGVIQSVAAAQANSLNFLSRWQSAYTNKLNQIHVFALGDNTVLGTFTALTLVGPFVPGQPPTFLYGNENWDQNAAESVRNTLNNINQSYISKLQANQQTISDSAKSLQSNVNQSNDAANQQGSVADSILQQLSTILSAIFR